LAGPLSGTSTMMPAQRQRLAKTSRAPRRSPSEERLADLDQRDRHRAPETELGRARGDSAEAGERLAIHGERLGEPACAM